MIESFLSSWDLFQWTYLAGWLLAVLLSMVGVMVVARDQIFIGAAVSQASTLGIVGAMWVASLAPFRELHWMESEAFLSACAVAASVMAALLTSGRREAGRESHESTTGWVFLLCASCSVLLASRSPHGLEEVQRLLSSSLIGAHWGDVALFATLLSDGSLGDIVVLKSPDPALSAEAIRALKNCHYRPLKLNGSPTETKMTFVFNFRLQ